MNRRTLHSIPRSLARLLPLVFAFLASPCFAERSNVLFVGNSLVYTNHLSILFQGLAAQQKDPPQVDTRMYATGGGAIAERWENGVVQEELATGYWNVLVLQERGGLLACVAKPDQREHPDCMASIAAHRRFARAAKAAGVRVVLLGTWGPDQNKQRALSVGLRRLAKQIDAEVLDAGPVLRAYDSAHPQTPMFTDDILHPSLDASLLLSGLLYRKIFAQPAQSVAFKPAGTLYSARIRPRADLPISTQAELEGERDPAVVTAERLAPLLQSANTAAID